jgi:tetratricopeptide (TPR) repeat protein
MPPTVQAVLAARVDRLPIDDKGLLQAAAVIGKDVAVLVLRSIAGQEEHEMLTRLGHLQAAEFLYESRLFPDLEYTFKHALTQEVVYGSLLQERRKELHARIVEAIERRHGSRLSEYVEVLARHAVRGQLWEKAVDYLSQAGMNAYTRGALEESLNRYEEALGLLPHLVANTENVGRAIDVRIDLQRLLWVLGQFSRMIQLSEEAERLARQINDRPRLARIWLLFARNSWIAARYSEGIEYAQQALAVAEASDHTVLRLASRFLLGAGHAARGEYATVVQVLTPMVEGADRLVAKQVPSSIGSYFVGSSFWLVVTLVAVGDFERAHRYSDAASDAAVAADSPHDEATAYLMQAVVSGDQGHFAEALSWSERALRLCETTPILPWLATAACRFGHALAASGRVAEGLADLERGVTFHESLGLKVYVSQFYVLWAGALLLARELDRAKQTAERALDLAVESGERGSEALALHVLGDVLLSDPAGNSELAYRQYERAKTIGEELGMRPLVAHCHLGLGKLYWRRGKGDEARGQFATATTMYREMGMTYWLEQADAEMRQLS